MWVLNCQRVPSVPRMPETRIILYRFPDKREVGLIVAAQTHAGLFIAMSSLLCCVWLLGICAIEALTGWTWLRVLAAAVIIEALGLLLLLFVARALSNAFLAITNIARAL